MAPPHGHHESDSTAPIPLGLDGPPEYALHTRRLLGLLFRSFMDWPYLETVRTRLCVDKDFDTMTSRDNNAKVPFFQVSDAYQPCITPIDDMGKLKLKELRVGHRFMNRVMIGRCYRAPSQSWPRLVFAIEDEHGDCCNVTLEYHERNTARSLPYGTLVAIKQPCLQLETLYPPGLRTEEDVKDTKIFWVIRIDHPSDLHDKPADAMTCKSLGNEALAKMDHWLAAKLYTDGLQVVGRHDEELEGDLSRNRSQAHLQLRHFDAAAADALQSIALTAGVDDRSKQLNGKAWYRAAMAMYQLRRFDMSQTYLQDMLLLIPDDVAGFQLMARVRDRLAEQMHASYDFEAIRRNCTKCGEMDVADFLRRTRVDTSPGRGKGLFTTEIIPAHGIILVEKAYAAAMPMDPTSRPAQRFYQRFGEDGSDLEIIINNGLNASILKNIVDALHRNPSTAPRVMHRYSRDYPKLVENAQRDVFLIEKICRSNSIIINGTAEDDFARSGNPGLWCQFSYINHACVANASLSFSGDLMIIRAQRELAKDEEITFSYRYPSSSFEADSFEMSKNFDFACDCPLCTAELSTQSKDRTRRNELLAEVGQLASWVDTVSQSDAQMNATLESSIKLLNNLSATYDDNLFYPGLPRRGLADVYSKIISLQCQMYQLDAAIDTSQDALESLGYHIRVSKLGEVDYRFVHGFDAGNAEKLLRDLIEIVQARQQSGAVKKLRKILRNLHSSRSVDPKGNGIPDLSQNVDSMEKALKALELNAL
ncbi:hypothetical protein LTR95_005798 [Oleoguttula sp. CCFEE 5521]